MYDIRITNSRIVNFENGKAEESDLFLKDGKIALIGSSSKAAKFTIDADGKLVSPGFIDIHMHEETLDLDAKDPYYTSYCELRMGVTTCVAGCCGRNRQPIDIFRSYIEKNGAPVNYLTSLGHITLREQVGCDDRYRKASPAELEKMKRLVRENEKHNFLGISYGIEYVPGVDLEELVEITKALSKDTYISSAHYRSDGENSLAALEEMCEISRLSGLPMQVSHIGSAAAMGQMKDFLKLLEKKISENNTIRADCYPYEAFATKIGSAVFDEGCFERWGKDYSDILLTEEPFKNQRCDKELFERVRKEYPNMVVVAFVMREEEVAEALRFPFTFVGSDSLFSNSTSGHPRGAGTFPRVLSRYVRELKSMEFMDALCKMTKAPAKRLGLKNKGDIKEGMDADITIFDENTIKDGATFQEPTLPPTGISHVILGGELAVENGRIVNGRLGRYIPV